MKVITAGIGLVLCIGIARGDIPDRTIDWDRLTILEHPGNDCLLDCTISSDGSRITCIGFTEIEDGLDFWIMQLDTAGIVIKRQEIFQDLFGLIEWAQAVFLGENLLAIVRGSGERSVPPDLHIIDVSLPEEQRSVSLSSLCMEDELLWIGALEYVSTEELMLAGTSWSPETGASLFAAKIDPYGRIHWQSFIFCSSDIYIDWLALKRLDDGGCVLTFSEDCFPSGMPVHRLSAHGEHTWDTFIEVDCEFGANLQNFQELEDGSVLCAGSFDQMSQMAFRGFTVCLDSGGEELWRRVDWYNDHTSWWDVQQVRDGGYILIGWTCTQGSFGFNIQDRNILLAALDESATSLRGVELAAPGNQLPRHVFLTDSGEILVIGTSVAEEHQDADIFLGRTELSEL